MWYVMQASNKAGYTIQRARDDFHRLAEFPGVTKIVFAKMPNFETALGFATHLAKSSKSFHYYVFKV